LNKVIKILKRWGEIQREREDRENEDGIEARREEQLSCNGRVGIYSITV
jgi:hypothetical protein